MWSEAWGRSGQISIHTLEVKARFVICVSEKIGTVAVARLFNHATTVQTRATIFVQTRIVQQRRGGKV
jgi:hypothetical protein